jgi:hypothetical protein
MSSSSEPCAAFYAVKLTSIGLVTIQFLIGGVILSKVLDSVFPAYDEAAYRRKSTCRVWAEVLLQVALVGIGAYCLRQLIRRIPLPTDGIAGFQQARLKENGGGVLIAFSVMLFQGANLGAKIKLLATR